MKGEVVVRPARAEDPVSEVIRTAFGGEHGSTVAHLWAEIDGSDLLRASLVAELEGAVIGHVGLSHAWLDTRRRLVDVWLLSPLGVRPERQGTGVGTRLVAAAIGLARDGGAPLLFLEGDPGYYGPRGFEQADRWGIAPPTWRTPAPAFQVVRYDSHEDWMTGQLIYRDVWWRHDLAGLRDPKLAEMEESSS